MLPEVAAGDVMVKSHPSGVCLYLIGRPSFDTEAFVHFLSDNQEEWRSTPEATDSEHLVEVAGRICYMSFGKRQHTNPNDAYVANLVRRGHESVLEHVNWTFVLTGVSRAFSHQLVRHRIGLAYSQLSQQYHEERDATFVEPAVIKDSPELSQLWRATVDGSRAAYNRILTALEKGVLVQKTSGEAREVLRALRTAARSVLPNATETKIVFTANARALRHFLEVRGNIVGDEEMRIVSSLILDTVKTEAPSLFQDFVSETKNDGLPVVLKRTP